MPIAQPTEPDVPVAEALTAQEFTDLALGTEETRSALEALSTVESTYIDVFPRLHHRLVSPYRAGATLWDDPTCFAFYFDKLHLVFIDGANYLRAAVLGVVAASGVMKQMTTAHCLFEFMKQLTKDDLEYLADLEDRMEDEEEAMLDRCEDVSNRRMLSFRRMLLRIDTYYQQLADMASVHRRKREQAPHPRGEPPVLAAGARQAERLLKRSQTLKEYSLQLRELYQTRIDIRQNDTIQWFTVITTLVRPAHASDQLVRHELRRTCRGWTGQGPTTWSLAWPWPSRPACWPSSGRRAGFRARRPAVAAGARGRRPPTRGESSATVRPLARVCARFSAFSPFFRSPLPRIAL